MTLTPDDVALDLKLSRQSIIRRLRTGEVPGFRVGRTWRIDEETYRQWKAQASTPVDPNRFTPRSRRSQAALDRKASR